MDDHLAGAKHRAKLLCWCVTHQQLLSSIANINFPDSAFGLVVRELQPSLSEVCTHIASTSLQALVQGEFREVPSIKSVVSACNLPAVPSSSSTGETQFSLIFELIQFGICMQALVQGEFREVPSIKAVVSACNLPAALQPPPPPPLPIHTSDSASKVGVRGSSALSSDGSTDGTSQDETPTLVNGTFKRRYCPLRSQLPYNAYWAKKIAI